jgi:hypothetical protein
MIVMVVSSIDPSSTMPENSVGPSIDGIQTKEHHNYTTELWRMWVRKSDISIDCCVK